MAVQLYTNKATGTLATLLGSGATTLTLDGGQGALFPNPGANEFFIATIEDVGGVVEIVKCITRSGDTFSNIVRAQEGTSAAAFAAGSRVECRLTAGSMTDLLQKSDEAIYNATVKTIIAKNGGMDLVGLDSFGTKQARIDFYDNTHTFPAGRLGYMLVQTTEGIWIVSEVHGAPVRLRGEDAGGVLRDLITADPDNFTQIFGGGGVERIRADLQGARVFGNLSAAGWIGFEDAAHAYILDMDATAAMEFVGGGVVTCLLDFDVTGVLSKSGVPVATVSKFASSNQSVATGSVAHGLGSMPDNWRVTLVCTTTNNGYAVGDEVDAASCSVSMSVWANATVVGWSVDTGVIGMVPKGGGSTTAIDNSKWRIIGRAAKFS